MRLLPPYQATKNPRDQLTTFMIAVDKAKGKMKRAQDQLQRMIEMRDKPRSVAISEELETFIQGEIEKHTAEIENAKQDLATNTALLKSHLRENPLLLDQSPSLRAEYFPETVVATPPPLHTFTLRPGILVQGQLFPQEPAETPVTSTYQPPLKAASRAARKKEEPTKKAERPWGAGTFLLNSDPDRAAERNEARRRQRSGETD